MHLAREHLMEIAQLKAGELGLDAGFAIAYKVFVTFCIFCSAKQIGP
jgi:hypothetical protein